MKRSENLRLYLPEPEDIFDIHELNDNFDKLDKPYDKIGADQKVLALMKDDRSPFFAFTDFTEGERDEIGTFSAFYRKDLDIDGDAVRFLAITNYSTIGSVLGRIGKEYFPFRYLVQEVLVSGTGEQSVDVTFPANYFKTPPVVVLTASTTVPDIASEVSWSAKTKDKIRVHRYRTTATATGVLVLAIERK